MSRGQPALIHFQSVLPGDPEDLGFTPRDFVNACMPAKDGPFTEDNEHFAKVLRMYNRLKTLRIKVIPFIVGHAPENLRFSPLGLLLLDLVGAPEELHPFGLPFSVQEFLVVCQEFNKSEFVCDQRGLEEAARYRGSGLVFNRMVEDLAALKINIKDFLADHVPAEMEDNQVLYTLLASTQGPHTQNNQVNLSRFRLLLKEPSRLSGGFSHLQAAVAVQSFQPARPTLYTPEQLQMFRGPHNLCEVGVESENLTFLYTPCCHQAFSKCCLMQNLMTYGSYCTTCYGDMVELHEASSSEEDSDEDTDEDIDE